MKNQDMLTSQKCKPTKCKVNQYVIQFEILINGYRGTVYTHFVDCVLHHNDSGAKELYSMITENIINEWSKELNIQITDSKLKINFITLLNSYEKSIV